MSGVKITITQSPELPELKARFEKRLMKLIDFTPFTKKAAIFLDRWVQQNFKSEGGKVGGWLPFKAGGRRRRGIGLDPTAKLLQDTGRLRLSYLPFSSKFDAGIGSRLPYSKFHEHGIGVPVRRVLPVQSDVKKAILEMLNRHAGEAAR